jgi:hypothetical protein
LRCCVRIRAAGRCESTRPWRVFCREHRATGRVPTRTDTRQVRVYARMACFLPRTPGNPARAHTHRHPAGASLRAHGVFSAANTRHPARAHTHRHPAGASLRARGLFSAAHTGNPARVHTPRHPARAHTSPARVLPRKGSPSRVYGIYIARHWRQSAWRNVVSARLGARPVW